MASKVKLPLDGALGPWEMTALEVVGRTGKKCRSDVFPVNGHEVDLMLRIKGKVNVAPDGETPKKTKPSAESLMAAVLAKLDAMSKAEPDPDRQQFLADLGPDLVSLLTADAKAKGADGALDAAPKFGVAAERLVATLTTTTSAPRKGSVTGSFEIGTIDLAQATAKAQATVAAIQEQLGGQFVTRRFVSGGED